MLWLLGLYRRLFWDSARDCFPAASLRWPSCLRHVPHLLLLKDSPQGHSPGVSSEGTGDTCFPVPLHLAVPLLEGEKGGRGLEMPVQCLWQSVGRTRTARPAWGWRVLLIAVHIFGSRLKHSE